MKKILTRIFAIAVLIISAMSLVACNIFVPTPNLNLEEAKENLEEKNYDVLYHEFAEDDIGEYDIYTGLAKVLSATNEDGETIEIMLFKTKKLAKFFYQTLEDKLNKTIEQDSIWLRTYKYQLKMFKNELNSDEIKQLEEQIRKGEEAISTIRKYVLGIRGNTVWYGVKIAVKDTK